MSQEKFHFDHELNLVSAAPVENMKFTNGETTYQTSRSPTGGWWKPKDDSPPVSELSSLQFNKLTQNYESVSSSGQITVLPKVKIEGTQIGAKTMDSITELKPFLRPVLSPKDRPGNLESVLYYFPNALVAIAALNVQGNKQHYPEGAPLQWKYNVSNNHAGKLLNHLVDHGTVDSDNVRHSTKVAWRALALLETELIEAGAVPGRSRVE